jgi:hypothetical protein
MSTTFRRFGGGTAAALTALALAGFVGASTGTAALPPAPPAQPAPGGGGLQNCDGPFLRYVWRVILGYHIN